MLRSYITRRLYSPVVTQCGRKTGSFAPRQSRPEFMLLWFHIQPLIVVVQSRCSRKIVLCDWEIKWMNESMLQTGNLALNSCNTLSLFSLRTVMGPQACLWHQFCTLGSSLHLSKSPFLYLWNENDEAYLWVAAIIDGRVYENIIIYYLAY